MSGGETKMIHVRLPLQVHGHLRELAFFSGETMSEIIVNALESWDLKAKVLAARQERGE